jgi:hypothetical protein
MLVLFSLSANGQEISVQAAVEKKQVFVGESFLFQIQVEGHSSPPEPDISSLVDFDVQTRGGQQNNSESITIINGQMERVSKQGYIFNYSLTPKKAGTLIIPSLYVNIDNKTYQTRPERISVREPVESDDFKLRVELEKSTLYVGEPVPLTVTWYIGKDVEGFDFTYPLADDPRFYLAALEPPGINQRNAIQIPLAGKTVIGKKGQGTLDGRQLVTVSFSQIFIPKQAGVFTLPQITVSARALVGYRQQQSRDPFADFFDRDFFGRGRRGVYETIVTPSNEVQIEVLPLPDNGRPSSFSGLVGDYSLVAEAAPTEVSVGDPITLKVMVTGPEYLDNVELPLLQEQEPLVRDFKIPDEMSAGEVQGRVKVFTQTIRAKYSDVKEIPALSLSYFNPETGKYAMARTEPIPLSVQTARIVTAQDAEGQQAVEVSRQEIKAFQKGIAYNYEDPDVLENEDQISLWLDSRWGLLFLLVPPGLYLLIFSLTTIVRRQQSDPEAQLARKAYGELVKDLKKLEQRSAENVSSGYIQLSEVLRGYLGKKLRITAGAITSHDVEKNITGRGVSEVTLRDLKHILGECEAHRFAGGTIGQSDLQNLVNQALQVAAELERSLK